MGYETTVDGFYWANKFSLEKFYIDVMGVYDPSKVLTGSSFSYLQYELATGSKYKID
jgi:hypothetical protein